MSPAEIQTAWKAYDAATRGGDQFAACVEAGFRAAYRAARQTAHDEFVEALATQHRQWRADNDIAEPAQS